MPAGNPNCGRRSSEALLHACERWRGAAEARRGCANGSPDRTRRRDRQLHRAAQRLAHREYGDIGYVTIESAAAEAIRAHELMRRLELGRRRGFGSVKVEAAIGASRWSTSVFPQKSGGWFLPVKKAICRAEDLAAEDEVEVRLALL